MSTRSLIGVRNNDGSIDAVYCHWDGYPSYNGNMLTTYYNSREQAKELIALGSISSLNKRIAPNEGETHTFDSPIKDVTIAYHRDRGEEYCPPAHFKDVARMKERASDCCAEYLYVWVGYWWCYDLYNKTVIDL